MRRRSIRWVMPKGMPQFPHFFPHQARDRVDEYGRHGPTEVAIQIQNTGVGGTSWNSNKGKVVDLHVPNCELFGGRSRYNGTSLLLRSVWVIHNTRKSTGSVFGVHLSWPSPLRRILKSTMSWALVQIWFRLSSVHQRCRSRSLSQLYHKLHGNEYGSGEAQVSNATHSDKPVHGIPHRVAALIFHYCECFPQC